MALACGSGHSAAVAEDGALLVWGRGEQGRLGLGSNTANRLTPTRVEVAPIKMVAARYDHTAMVTAAGDLLMCGRGSEGQLGVGDLVTRTTPTLVERALFDGDAVQMVACGERHSAALTEASGVYTFGYGGRGRLGHGDAENQLAPRRVPAAAFNDERVVMVDAGSAHTVALSEAGHVYTWGHGGDGQLGHDNTEDLCAPRLVEPGLFGGEKVVFVAAGGLHTLAITAGGRLYTWGLGAFGQLGHGDHANRLVPTLVGGGAFGGSAVLMAACGLFHSLLVTRDGALWASGNGADGQLGLDKCRHTMLLHFERVLGVPPIVAVAAGDSNSAAVSVNGSLYTWGNGAAGRLGHGDVLRHVVPTEVTSAGARIGRCRGLPAEHALAFAMGTHNRLGAAADAHCSALAAEPGLVALIVHLCLAWQAAGETEGLLRLLGGSVVISTAA